MFGEYKMILNVVMEKVTWLRRIYLTKIVKILHDNKLTSGSKSDC